MGVCEKTAADRPIMTVPGDCTNWVSVRTFDSNDYASWGPGAWAHRHVSDRHAAPLVRREASRLWCAVRRLLDRQARSETLTGALSAWCKAVDVLQKRRRDAFVDAMGEQMRAAKRCRLGLERHAWRHGPVRQVIATWRGEARLERERRAWLKTTVHALQRSAAEIASATASRLFQAWRQTVCSSESKGRNSNMNNTSDVKSSRMQKIVRTSCTTFLESDASPNSMNVWFPFGSCEEFEPIQHDTCQADHQDLMPSPPSWISQIPSPQEFGRQSSWQQKREVESESLLGLSNGDENLSPQCIRKETFFDNTQYNAQMPIEMPVDQPVFREVSLGCVATGEECQSVPCLLCRYASQQPPRFHRVEQQPACSESDPDPETSIDLDLRPATGQTTPSARSRTLQMSSAASTGSRDKRSAARSSSTGRLLPWEVRMQETGSRETGSREAASRVAEEPCLGRRTSRETPNTSFTPPLSSSRSASAGGARKVSRRDASPQVSPRAAPMSMSSCATPRESSLPHGPERLFYDTSRYTGCARFGAGEAPPPVRRTSKRCIR